MKKEKTIIGRKEMASFPGFKLNDIPVKIDTGAYTSSIHCHSIEERDGALYCKFLDPTRRSYTGEEIVFEVYTEKKVKSSNGAVENRYKIVSSIEILGETYKIDLTLTNRKKMKTPVLLGRKFLAKRFLVDVSKKYHQQK